MIRATKKDKRAKGQNGQKRAKRAEKGFVAKILIKSKKGKIHRSL